MFVCVCACGSGRVRVWKGARVAEGECGGVSVVGCECGGSESVVG